MSQTQRVVLFPRHDPLELESGAAIGPVEVAFETVGRLSRERDNAVFVCHALTGDAHAAGPEGWWATMVGPGRAIDTDRFFVISPNLLGGCQGTTGPRDLGFPLFSVRDLVRVHRRLLAHLGIERLVGVAGGSLGGMQALQWLLDAPEQARSAVVIAASARLSDQNIALSAVARAAILEADDLQRGMSLARRIGHITYLSEASMASKFGARRGDPAAPMTLGDDFEVERYLRHQGERFVERFDPLSYLYLSRAMDYFDPFADPGLDLSRVAASGAAVLALSFSSDWRFSPAQSAALTETLSAAGVAASHLTIPSAAGHDSFLLTVPGYQSAVADFLTARDLRATPAPAPPPPTPATARGDHAGAPRPG